MFFLIHSAKEWNPIHRSTGILSIKLWPLHTWLYIVLYTNCLRKQWNQPRPVSHQPSSGPCYRVHMFFLIYTTKVRKLILMSRAFYLSSSGHHTWLYSSYTNLRKPWNQPRPVSPQPSTRLCYRVYMFFILHTTKVWNPIHRFTSITSVQR
jgi:hypothetical protein